MESMTGPLVLLLGHLVRPSDLLDVGQVRGSVRLPEEGLADLGQVLLRRHLFLRGLSRDLEVLEKSASLSRATVIAQVVEQVTGFWV